MSRDGGQITLIRTSTGWSAKFSGEAGDEIRSLFGTDTIPTAFTAEAPAKKVQQQIHSQWPKCLITVQEGE
jgi:hypothetical protein